MKRTDSGTTPTEEGVALGSGPQHGDGDSSSDADGETDTDTDSDSDSDSDSGSPGADTDSEGEEGEEAERAEEEETVSYGEHDAQVPRGLCERPELLEDIVTEQAWRGLSARDRERLGTLLPPGETAAEREETLGMLFRREPLRFEAPLRSFQRKLGAGLFRPELRKAKAALEKAEGRRRRRERKLEWYRTMREVLICRERFLASVGSAPSATRSLPGRPLSFVPQALRRRARRRYFEELTAVRREACGDRVLSEDENYPEGPPSPRPTIERRTAFDPKNLRAGGDVDVFSTIGREDPRLPKFDDGWRRAALANRRERKRRRPDRLESEATGVDPERVSCRARRNPPAADLERASADAPPRIDGKRPRRSPPTVRAEVPIVRRPSSGRSPTDRSESDAEVLEPDARSSRPLPIPTSGRTLSQFPPRAQIKSEIKPAEEKPSEEVNVELVQATHACFFSVLRDLVCSTPRHCMPLLSLTASLRTWRQNPIAPLNHWYCFADDWIKALPSAVNFLTGESQTPDDFVPYLQYKPTTQVYQWIGAGRDTDSLLTPLCAYWLAHRQQSATMLPPPAASPPPVLTAESNQQLSMCQPSSKVSNQLQLSNSELESFRIQEKERFLKPHRAFTYRLSKGNAIVGPLRGVYASEENSVNKVARGHTLLCPERPRHVTLLALVRDAVACLPNGEGTRAHITSLLRRSQYLVSDANEQTLQAAVSGALDRMHCSPDPCVKYVPTRKLWIYLHKERTEEEFERLHAENQIQGKLKAAALAQQKRNANASSTKSRSKSKPATSVNKTVETPSPVETASIVLPLTECTAMDVDGDDINIDVEGSLDAPIITIPTSLNSQIVTTIGTSSPTTTLTFSDVTSASVATAASSQADNISTTEKPNIIYSAVPGTSLLQPRSNVFSSNVCRQTNTSNAKNAVRVLNSSPASNKSLISPRALQPNILSTSANRLSQTKLIVQRTGGGQSSGALSPAQQRLLLESLMQHQKTHGQSITDQLLQTIQSTQKLSTPTTTLTGTPTTNSKPSNASQQTIQLGGQTVQLPSGQTVQLTNQTVQLGSQSTVQAVQLSGQTMQLAGQTVHLGNQTIQLTGQSVVRPTNVDSPTRVTVQRQSTPLVAKILANAQQLRGSSSNVGNRQQLRVTNLSLAQLQGKPVLLHTSSNASASDILLQANNLGASQNTTEINATSQRVTTPTTQQHALLLSNIGGQVVRVASGGGTILGQALRLQTTNSSPTAQNRGSGTTGVIFQGGQTLKLQTAPIRLHQNTLPGGSGASAGNRVLLAGGTRLQGLKLLPVQQAVRGSTPIGNRQVYARIVSPAGTTLNTTTPANATVVSGANILNTILRPSNPTISGNQQPSSK